MRIRSAPSRRSRRRAKAPAAASAAPSASAPRRGRRPRGLVIGVAAAVALLAAGGGTAFAMDKRITVDVDGQTRTVHTFGGTVAEVLDSAGVTLDEQDAVAPSPDTELGQGGMILVRSARDLTLDIEGEEQTHRVTALTVGEALGQIGLADEALTLSVERSEEIPLEGLRVEARQGRHLVILRDQVRIEVDTVAATVGEVLEENGITLGEHDEVEPAADTKVTDGMVIDVTQLLGEPKTKEVPIEAEVEERENPDLDEGEKKVVTEPEDGVKKVTYAMVMEEGEETEVVLKEEVVKEPVAGVTEIGTKEEEPEVDPNVGGSADSLNWAGLAQCESGGDPTAVNPAGYYGLYQFSIPTWQSAGGSGLPSEASPEEQTMRAKTLYNMVGGNWQSQWPVCGVHLHQ
ncbi:ubiquitin-like domain-containing protein [Marinactinospora thermotolerans]|uniref:ubiquitin-like domain-containing protein n=1 Tax=Marinactinospora thermotolerans TaxID=531310 RepID=UPI003D8C5E31